MDLYSSLVSIAGHVSAGIGVTGLAPFPDEADRLKDRVSKGLHGGLSFTYAKPDLASNPALSFPWACSIVVTAVPYLAQGDGDGTSRTVARFADGDRYEGLRSLLGDLAQTLQDAGHAAEIVFDDNRIIDRAVAIRAGVAWSGKSTMVLAPGSGPWILIGSVVTDAELPHTKAMLRNCGTCDACIPACPTNAIIEPGVLDAGRCISAVLQRRGPIPHDLREAIGGRIYGCDECLTACPPGKPTLAGFEPTSQGLKPTDVLEMTDSDLAPLVDHWYIPSRRLRFVRRNALVALGNDRDENSLGLLARYLADPDPLLAGHAAWAIGRVGVPAGTALCVAALETVADETVLAELVAAVAASERGGVYADSMTRVTLSAAAVSESEEKETEENQT